MRPSFQRSRETRTGRSASGTKPSASQSVMERRSLKRAAPILAGNLREVRLLRSTGITPFPRYEPVRLPADAVGQLWIPVRRCADTCTRRRVSQDPRLVCRHAPSPLTPGSPLRACARCFRIGDRLQHLRKIGRCHWFHEAESGSLALGSRLRSSRPSLVVRPAAIARPDRPVSRSQLPFYAGPELHGERAIHMADTSQSARRIRVTLAHRRKRRRHVQRIAAPGQPSNEDRSVSSVGFVAPLLKSGISGSSLSPRIFSDVRISDATLMFSL